LCATRDADGGTQSEWSKGASVTLEQLVAAMDEAGVDKRHRAFVTTYGFNNDYVVTRSRRIQTLTGVFSVNITQADAPDRMRYWFSKGMTGMRLLRAGSTIKESTGLPS